MLMYLYSLVITTIALGQQLIVHHVSPPANVLQQNDLEIRTTVLELDEKVGPGLSDTSAGRLVDGQALLARVWRSAAVLQAQDKGVREEVNR
jgi:hypothetical protein